MAASTLVDAGFLVALVRQNDNLRDWASGQAEEFPPPWFTCESALGEAFHLLDRRGGEAVAELMRRGYVGVRFGLAEEQTALLALIDKYAAVPMSLADACLVRMTEVLPDPVLLTTDVDFRIYRRHGRQVVPCILPG